MNNIILNHSGFAQRFACRGKRSIRGRRIPPGVFGSRPMTTSQVAEKQSPQESRHNGRRSLCHGDAHRPRDRPAGHAQADRRRSPRTWASRPSCSSRYGELVAKIELDAIEELAGPAEGAGTSSSRRSRRRRSARARPPRRSAWARRSATSASRRRSPSASRRWARRSASRAAPPAAATARSVPMELLNLHLTGDFHAVTAAHNLLVRDGRQPPAPGQRARPRPAQHHLAARARRQRPGAAQHRDRPRRGRRTASPRQTGFDITAASEVMAVLALATSLAGPARRGSAASSSATRKPASRSPPSSSRRPARWR